MACSDFNNQIMDLNNNVLDYSFDNQYLTTEPIANEFNDSQETIENEFNQFHFDHNQDVQSRDDIEFIVDTYLFIEKTKRFLLSFCL
jgi:hypothetical protein